MGRPLDKQEAIPYGHFVDALYARFKRDRNLSERSSKDIPVRYELAASKLFRSSSRETGFPSDEPTKCDRNFLSRIVKVPALVLAWDNHALARMGRFSSRHLRFDPATNLPVLRFLSLPPPCQRPGPSVQPR